MENTSIKPLKMKLDTMPLLGMKRKPAVRRRRHGTLQSRCAHCDEAVQFKTYKTLTSFLNQGRVCDSCVTRNLTRARAEDTFVGSKSL